MKTMTYLDPRESIWPGLVSGLCLAVIMTALEQPEAIVITAVVAWLCMLWWIFEPLPIPVTSLLPIAVFPISGVLTPEQVGASVGSPLIILLLGGFLLSRGMESTGAHHRIALSVVNLVGGHKPRRLVLGFMIAGALLSMWISNTASILMLMPVALAVLASCSDRNSLAAPLLLGLAWSCSIGGLGTPIGTPPNLILVQVYEENTAQTISFGQWMSWGIPVVLTLLPLAWWWVTRAVPRELDIQLPAVGPWRSAERRVLVVFGLTAVAWITRAEPFGGWQTWLDLPAANDASVALLAVVALFVVRDDQGEPLIDWAKASQIPWGVLLLFGGGICLARAFVASGLSAQVGDALTTVAALPVFAMMLLLALAVTFLTEATSNTATTALLMPVLAAVALAVEIDPLWLMVPAAMSASCAFMLPVATAPNAVVFGSGELPIRRMVREGFALNLMGALLIATVAWVLLT
ncbi:MAG: SLC13 family permease [Halieaceae bacterium]|jgi:sodium-dependent dicarboxylate transporter 2/3/5